MRRILVLLAMALSVGGQSYEFRLWNDIAANPAASKPVDYLRRPHTLVAAPNGGFYVSDELDYRVRRVDASGSVESLAGLGSPGNVSELMPGVQARLSKPRELCLDGLGALWIADGGRTLRRLSAEKVLDSFGVNLSSTGGLPAAGLVETPMRNLDHDISALSCDGAGFAYFADRKSASIVRVDLRGMAVRVAGSGSSVGSALQSLAVEDRALSYSFRSIDGLSWVDGNLFVLDSGRIHRLRLSSGTLRSVCTWASREKPELERWPKAIVGESARLLVLEGSQRVGEIARSAWEGAHFTVGVALPVQAFDFARHEMEIASLARLADGSYAVATAMPPNVYRSWGQEWISVLGSRVREERVPLALMNGYVPYFDWTSADGEALFLARAGMIGGTITGGITPRAAEASRPGAEPEWSSFLAEQYQGEALAGYRQGDDFVSIYNSSNTINSYRYEPNVEWLRDGAGAWVKVKTQDGVAERRLPQAAKAEALIPPITGRVNGIALRARGGLWFWQEGSVHLFDPDQNTSRRVGGNGTNRIVEGGAMQSGWRDGLAKEDFEGRLVQSTDFAITQGPDYGQYGVIYRLDAERGDISRLAGTPGKAMNATGLAEGVDVRNRQLDAFPRSTPCGAGGKLLMSAAYSEHLYIVDERSVARKIAGSNLPQPTPTGDPLVSGYGLHGFRCFADGAILIGDGRFQRRTRELVPLDYLRLKKVFGDEQAGEISQVLPTALTIQAVRAGAAVAGRRVTYKILKGSGTLSQSEAITDGQGLAGVTLRLADKPGVVWVEGRLDTGATVVFRASARFPVRPIPRIYSGGVGGAALSVPFLRRLAPGGIATIFGENFSERGVTLGASDLVGGRVPTMLGDVCVEVGGQKAFLFAVFPGQINFQTPNAGAGREQEVKVVRGCGTASEVRSAGEVVNVAAEAPEFFYESYSADGRSPVIVVRSSDGSVGAARPGEWISLFATGLGATEPAVAPGVVAAGIARVRGAFRLRIGMNDVAAEDVFYAGVAPGTAGQYQINVRVPEDLAVGEWPILMSVGNASSPVGPVIRVAAN